MYLRIEMNGRRKTGRLEICILFTTIYLLFHLHYSLGLACGLEWFSLGCTRDNVPDDGLTGLKGIQNILNGRIRWFTWYYKDLEG